MYVFYRCCFSQTGSDYSPPLRRGSVQRNTTRFYTLLGLLLQRSTATPDTTRKSNVFKNVRNIQPEDTVQVENPVLLTLTYYAEEAFVKLYVNVYWHMLKYTDEPKE